MIRGLAGDATRLPHHALLPNNFSLKVLLFFDPGYPHEIGVEDLASEIISIHHLRSNLDVHDRSTIVLQSVHLVIDHLWCDLDRHDSPVLALLARLHESNESILIGPICSQLISETN